MSAAYQRLEGPGAPYHSRQPPQQPPQPPQPYQVSYDTTPRYYPSPEEQQRYNGNQPPTTDFQTRYVDSFVSVVIDGNRFQFLDGFVAGDEAGGRQAAMALTHAIAEMLDHMGYEVMRVIIRIFGNPEWLSDAYLYANVIPHGVNFGWFLHGFNSVESLVEFVALDDGPCTPVYRMRDAADLLKINLLDPHCALILYGGPLTDATTHFLTTHSQTTINDRILLLSTPQGTPNPLPTHPLLSRITLPTIFHPTPHLPHLPVPKPYIHRNAHGQRIDPPLNPKETTVAWLRAQKFCNNHFLQGHCPEPRCKARHDGRLTAEQLDGLRYLGRSLPCRYSNTCRDPACYAGHMCPFAPCANRNCKFYAEMHVEDRRIVAREE